MRQVEPFSPLLIFWLSLCNSQLIVCISEGVVFLFLLWAVTVLFILSDTFIQILYFFSKSNIDVIFYFFIILDNTTVVTDIEVCILKLTWTITRWCCFYRVQEMGVHLSTMRRWLPSFSSQVCFILHFQFVSQTWCVGI